MTMFYSPSTKSIYSSDLKYPVLPDDIIELTSVELKNLTVQINKNFKDVQVVNGAIVYVDRIPISPSWDEIRSKRNALLAACDWTQMINDVPSTVDIAAWKVYRQELRDITTSFTDTNKIIWPIPPKLP